MDKFKVIYDNTLLRSTILVQGHEKRKEKRHLANPTLEFQGEIRQVRNLSVHGVGFYCDRNIDTNRFYYIRLKYPPEHGFLDGVDVQLRISVRYCRLDPIRNCMVIGAEFVDLNEAHITILEKLTQFMEEFNKNWGLEF